MADELLERLSSRHRLTDVAIQFVEFVRGEDGKAKASGRESAVYGGTWDVVRCCYSAEEPSKVIRYACSGKQLDVLEAAASGQYHHLLVKGARRSSKSELLALWTILRAVIVPGAPINLAFVKFKKAQKWFRQKLWPRIASLCLPGKAGYRKSPNEFGCTLRNGTVVGFITAEVVDDPRGDGVGSVGCDERQIVGKELMDNLMLSLSEAGDDYQTLENGTALQGEFQDYYEEVSADPDYLVVEMTSFDNPFIATGFIENAKKHMDPRRYAQEVLAQFAPQSSVVYHQYERGTHLKRYAQARETLLQRYGGSPKLGADITSAICRQWFDADVEFIIGMDFNVSPMCAVIFKVLQGPPGVGDIWWAIDECILDDRADATRMAIELKRRGFYPAVVVPDASGRHSEGGRSSHRMLRDEGLIVSAPLKNPHVADRINSVNCLLMNAQNHVRLLIDPKCKSLVKCLENHKVDPSGKPEKDKIHEHRGDALGYPIAMLCPATVDWERDRKLARERMAAIG